MLAWETGNELGEWPMPPLPPSWSIMICEYIKTLSSKQLVVDGRDGIDPEELENDCFDIYSQHFYPMNTDSMHESAERVMDKNKVFFVGEFGWNENKRNPIRDASSLPDFLHGIETSNTSMDCYWSLFPHNDSHGFEYHDDGFSLYYPGNQPGDDQQENVVRLRDHAYSMAGLQSAPAYPLCGTPFVSKVPGNRTSRTVYWRGGWGCFDYEIQRNDKSDSQQDSSWASVAKGVSDFAGYHVDEEAVPAAQNCVYYRVRGKNYNERYSDFSSVYSFCS